MQNGQTGPRTSDGKAIAAWNARAHGILSSSPVVPGLDAAEDWEAHRQGLLRDLQPVGELEEHLAERVALGFWRLRRVARHEQQSIAISQEAAPESCCRRGETPQSILAAVPACEAHHTLLMVLPEMRPDSPLVTAPAAAVLGRASELLDDCSPLAHPIEGLHGDLKDPGDFNGWTAVLLRRALDRLAAAHGVDPKTLRSDMLRGAAEELAGARARAEEFTRELDRARRRQGVPSPEQQDRISR